MNIKTFGTVVGVISIGFHASTVQGVTLASKRNALEAKVEAVTAKNKQKEAISNQVSEACVSLESAIELYKTDLGSAAADCTSARNAVKEARDVVFAARNQVDFHQSAVDSTQGKIRGATSSLANFNKNQRKNKASL